MPLGALALLFGSAILHTTWNLLLKQAGEKYMATWWGMLLGSLLFLPAALLPRSARSQHLAAARSSAHSSKPPTSWCSPSPMTMPIFLSSTPWRAAPPRP